MSSSPPARLLEINTSAGIRIVVPPGATVDDLRGARERLLLAIAGRDPGGVEHRLQMLGRQTAEWTTTLERECLRRGLELRETEHAAAVAATAGRVYRWGNDRTNPEVQP